MSSANGLSAAPPAQWFDPFVQHNLVLGKTTWQAAAKVDLPFVDQATQPNRQGFLVPSKSPLLGGNPGDLSFRDHAAGKGLQKDFPDSHESHATTSLHAVASRLGLWPGRTDDRMTTSASAQTQPVRHKLLATWLRRGERERRVSRILRL